MKNTDTHSAHAGGRTGGKTLLVLQAAVRRSLEQGLPVAVTSENTKDMILQAAAGQGVEIPEPVVVNLHDRCPQGVTFAGIIIDRNI